MSAVLLRLQVEARSRWRSWLSVAVLAGLLGGATIAALAGARRTETAYTRFLEGTNAFDVLVPNGGTTPDNVNRQFDFQEVSRLPQVSDAAVLHYYFVGGGTLPSGRALLPSDVSPFASPDGRFGREVNRLHVLEGRLPRRQQEVAVTFLAADRLALHVGDTMRMQLVGPEAMATASVEGSDIGVGGREAGGAEDFRVVGLVAMEGGFHPLTGGLPPPVILSPAYARAHSDAAQVLAARLHGGRRDIAAFEGELDRLAGGQQVVTTNEIEQTSVVQRSLRVEASALRILAALVAAVALLLVAQALVREGSGDSSDHRALRALGATPAQLRGVGLGRALLIALAATGLAAVTAVALSPLSPVGVARKAELDPGVEVNVAYVGAGTGGVLLLVAILGAVAAWWSARPAASGGDSRRGLSGWVSTLVRAGLPTPAVAGLRMGLEPGRGRTSVPVRSTIASVAVAVGTVAGAVSFSASLGNLFDQPRLYGWNWDVQLGDAFSPALEDEAERLDRHPAVAALAVGTISRLQIGHLRVDTLASEPVRGQLGPTVVEGRAPSRTTEILLGTRTLRDLGLDVGDAVKVESGDRTVRMRVVGRGVLTEFAGAARLGEGAAVTLGGMRRIVPGTAADVVLLRLRPGAGREALLHEFTTAPPANVYLPAKPSDLADLERVGGLPSVVAGVVAVMAVATLSHTLVTLVRRRRRDLAVLKVLGFVQRQISASVAWQSSAVAVVAVVVGVPLGVAAGRWAWDVFADRLGVPPQPGTPLLALALLVPATVVLANVVAAVPGRLAARTRPSSVLRSE